MRRILATLLVLLALAEDAAAAIERRPFLFRMAGSCFHDEEVHENIVLGEI